MKIILIKYFIICALLVYTFHDAFAATSTETLQGGSTVTTLTQSDTSPLFNLNENPLATAYNICDDCNAGPIDLGFNFKYFNQDFSQAWMYSNGVLGFQTPSWQSFCCDGMNLNSSIGTDYNYKIFALWTDLIGGQGNFYSLKTDSSYIFGWYNIAEYGTSNLNSFEIQLNSDNTFKVIYGNVGISSHSVTMGFTGNTAAGEFYQYYNGSQSSQTKSNSTFSYQPFIDPCVENPMYSTSCPGYDQAYFNFQCSINPLYNSQCSGYDQAYAQQLALQNVETQQNNPVTEPVNESSTSQTTLTEPITSPGMVGDTTSTFQEVRTDVGGASISTTGALVIETGIPDIVKQPQTAKTENQTSESSSPQPTISDSIQGVEEKQNASSNVDALSVAKNAVAETDRVASAVVNQSVQKSLEDVFNSTQIEQGLQQYVESSNTLIDAMTGSAAADPSTSYGTDSSLIAYANEATYNASAEYTDKNVNQFAAPQSSIQNNSGIDQTVTSIENKQEIINSSSMTKDEESSSTSLQENNKQDLLDIVKKEDNKNRQEEVKNEGDKETVNKDAQENEAAVGGISLNDISNNSSLDAYNKIFLLDSAFYQPKEIYKNNKPVDNEKLLRSFNYKNDKLHQEMVNQQYR